MLETTDGGFTKTADAGLVVDRVAVATVTSGDSCAKELGLAVMVIRCMMIVSKCVTGFLCVMMVMCRN